MSATKSRSPRLAITRLENRDVPARVVGYYPEWATWGRNYQPADIPASKMTHVVYSFAKIDANNQIALFDEWAALNKDFGPAGPDQYDGLLGQFRLMKLNNPNVKTSIAVGGWSLSQQFPTMASTQANRTTFINSSVNFIRQYNFDGVDLDWEYPVSGNTEYPPVGAGPADKHNFTLLCQELRAALDIAGTQDGKHYSLSAALGASHSVIDNYELAPVAQALDWVSAMTYDYHGAFDPMTNHQSALYPDPSRVGTPGYEPRNNLSWATDEFLARGVPADKLMLGLALYGRNWAGVGPTNNGLGQPATGAGPGTWENGVLDYKDLHNKVTTQPGVYQRHWDSVSQTAYVYAPTVAGGMFSTYDDAQSIRAKLDFAHQKQLGGVLMWEISADLPVTHQDSIIRMASESVLTPEVTSVKVNDGTSDQRSMVKSLQVTFDTEVTFVGAPATAFSLTRIGGTGAVGFTATVAVVNGKTVVTLGSFTGALTEFGSLRDGRYSLSVVSSKVRTAYGFLDGDGNGTAGDDYVLQGNTANKLFRLFGDVDGNGIVNAFDLGRFRPSFGSSTGQAAYVDWLDANGDGIINAFDFGQIRNRFGASVP